MSDFSDSFSQHTDETLALCTYSIAMDVHVHVSSCCSAQMTNPSVYSSIADENITKIPASCRACFYRGMSVVFLAYCIHSGLCKPVHVAWIKCKVWTCFAEPFEVSRCVVKVYHYKLMNLCTRQVIASHRLSTS